MGLGRQGDQQGTMYLAWDETPRSHGHPSYDRLQQTLRKSGIDSERGIKWRCADSLSLRDFLQLSTKELVPDHSSLSRAQISSMAGKAMGTQRTELVERSFEHTLDRAGGMRRVWLRGREIIQKRYLLHVAGFNLGLLMRLKTGYGTPRGWANAWSVIIWPDSHVSWAYLTVVLLAEDISVQIIPMAGILRWCHCDAQLR